MEETNSEPVEPFPVPGVSEPVQPGVAIFATLYNRDPALDAIMDHIRYRGTTGLFLIYRLAGVVPNGDRTDDRCKNVLG